MKLAIAGAIIISSCSLAAAQGTTPQISFATGLGAYLVEEGGGCRSSKSYLGETPDVQFGQVCIPQGTVQHVDAYTLSLIIAELTDPHLYSALLVKKVMGDAPVSEAYEVIIEKSNDDIFDLTDGTVLRKTGYGYVGYVGYREEGILYGDYGRWKFCVNGSSFDVEILREAQRSYGRSAITATENEIKRMDACR